jgi:hypothetical protein
VDDWQHAPDRTHLGLVFLAQTLLGTIRSMNLMLPFCSGQGGLLA